MNENKFEYTYTAPTELERRQIKAIKQEYVGAPSSNMQKLEKLHKHVKSCALVPALIIGIIGTLIFGLGLTMVLEWGLIFWGICVSGIGAIPMAVAPFVHKAILKAQKEKHKVEILELCDSLEKE